MMNLPETPLFDVISQYEKKGRASFHTPGHKGHAWPLENLQLLAHDLTELPETASLYDGGDAIELAERMAAQAFGASLTLFSAGGCTLCIQTMLLLGAGAGGKVIFARNSHRSAVHAAALLGIEPVWAWPSDKNGQVSPGDIAACLLSPDSRNIRGVYITSPDYYGTLADIPAIAALCKKAGIPLLVDNAHGSHLGAFGLHPLALGASMTADSLHKTMPVLTGGAMLHIGAAFPSVERQATKAAMSLFGSTSPGFPVLASLDLARSWWETEGREAYRRTAEQVEKLARAAVDADIPAFRSVLHDPARLTLDFSKTGVDGNTAAEYFREQGCEPEYADSCFVVFIVTPFNTQQELDKLKAAIQGFQPTISRLQEKTGRFPEQSDWSWIALDVRPAEKPTVILSPREALLAPSETVSAGKAAGRIAARTVCPCPPGIAAVVPGEQITKAAAEQLSVRGFDHFVVVKTL